MSLALRLLELADGAPGEIGRVTRASALRRADRSLGEVVFSARCGTTIKAGRISEETLGTSEFTRASATDHLIVQHRDIAYGMEDSSDAAQT
jgi:hypothetical protein